ncbi:MAG: ATP-binding protein [Chloroflexota bacterium]
MTPAEALRASQLFAHLPDDELARLVDMSEPMRLRAGEQLLTEGTEAHEFFVIVEGEVSVTKRSGEGEVPIAVVGPGGIVGEMAVIEDRARNASVIARTDVAVLRVPSEALSSVLQRPETALAILRTVMGRLRSTEALLREREKLAALGTLSAGLAHELNNPAAAVRRSADALRDALAARDAMTKPEDIPPPPARRTLGALERAHAADALSGVVSDPVGAAALVDAGWTAEALRALPAETVAWLAADASVSELLGELRLASGRISEIVDAVRGYAYLDQGPVQRVDVRIGLEQTLVILRHRLKHGVEIRRELADDLPEIEAFGSELNQVWTNLIDNAVDAMGETGTLTLRGERDGDGVRVAICDTGSGIPDSIRGRLFEPFATTKPPGSGTGLGLHISHSVVARHGGRLEVESEPGRTCFTVTLPGRPPDSQTPASPGGVRAR